jgi:uncharacterized protein (TIGR03067 family)
MNALCLLLIAQALLYADASEKKPDLAQLQGAWRVTATEFDGQAVSAETLKDRQIVFAENKFKVVVGDTTRGTRSFKLDASKNPKHIDIANPEKQETALGIYRLEKDVLKLCYGEPSAARPTEFASPAGKRLYFITLERQKP